MEKFVQHRGVVAPLAQSNVDTDQIIPARFLHRPRADGYGEQLFADLRFDPQGAPREDFVLNRAPFDEASILVSLANFGCGSSREHAVWALADFGFRAVIAPSFGDIFYNNALQNGLLAVPLPPAEIDRLIEMATTRPGLALDVDLAARSIKGDGFSATFEIDAYAREALMLGLSETAMTLRHLPEIEAFERRQREDAPWLAAPRLPTPQPTRP